MLYIQLAIAVISQLCSFSLDFRPCDLDKLQVGCNESAIHSNDQLNASPSPSQLLFCTALYLTIALALLVNEASPLQAAYALLIAQKTHARNHKSMMPWSLKGM